jgi:hypothetical protein
MKYLSHHGPRVSLPFLSSSNRIYTLWSSPSLPGTWAPVASQESIFGNGELMELQDTNSSPAQFCRVSVSVP